MAVAVALIREKICSLEFRVSELENKMAGVDGYARDKISSLEFRVEQLEAKLESLVRDLLKVLQENEER